MNRPNPSSKQPPSPGDITYFAESDYRNRNTKFGIRRDDRTRHMYVIGKTGMGKTTLLENMAVQDIRNGNGMAFIDPHGEVADNLLDYIPEDRIKDVMYFAPFDLNHPISFNVMEDVGDDKRHLVADGLLSAFKKIWVDMWSGRMEYLLNNALLALLEYPDATILGVNRMFADKAYRERVVANVKDVSVKAFWEDEFANYDQQFAAQAASAIQNKVGQFVSNPQVRNIVGQVKSSFDVREMMDNNKIMLINLSKGQVGEDNARLIGSMLITKMYLAAMSRADSNTQGKDISQLPQFYFYVDEFQSFANESFAGILSEARKYKLNLTIAHQYIEQMTEDVRNAVFGNVGTMISFRVGAFDAEVLEKEFAPKFEAEDLVNLGFAQIYLKLMINGVSSSPFSARTLPPIEPRGNSFRGEVREWSREHYGRPRDEVEREIDRWHDSTYGIIDEDLERAVAKAQKDRLGDAAPEEPLPDKGELLEKYEEGQVVEGVITNIVDFGIFVRVERGLEGLVHISEIADKKIDNPAELFDVDEEITVKVIEIDKKEKKISLSVKQLEDEDEDPTSHEAPRGKEKIKDKGEEQGDDSDNEEEKSNDQSEEDEEAGKEELKDEDKESKEDDKEETEDKGSNPPSHKATEGEGKKGKDKDREEKNKKKNEKSHKEKGKQEESKENESDADQNKTKLEPKLIKKAKQKEEVKTEEAKSDENLIGLEKVGDKGSKTKDEGKGKTASLKDLAGKTQKKDDGKSPSVANKSKLQQALEKVKAAGGNNQDESREDKGSKMKDESEKQDDPPSHKATEGKGRADTESDTKQKKADQMEVPKAPHTESPPEFSEEELREMLSVDVDEEKEE